MIRPIPRHNPEREKISYPQYGQFGYEEPVGRKHLGSKTSAIHKLIFNEQPASITRDTYNELKLGLRRTEEEIARENSNRSYNQSQRFRYSMAYSPSEREYLNHSYELPQPNPQSRRPYDEKQSRISDEIFVPNRANDRRMDSLDKILNPYKNYESMMNRQKPLPPNRGNSYMQSNIPSTLNKQSEKVMREAPQRTIADSSYQKQMRNPTFLNSLL